MLDPNKLFVGMEVVCVKELQFPSWGGFSGIPNMWQRYKIRDIYYYPDKDRYGVVLEGIVAARGDDGKEHNFGLSVFDYVYNTDISIFKKFLKPSKATINKYLNEKVSDGRIKKPNGKRKKII